MNNFDDILKMAANVQGEVERAQAALDTIEVEGQAGGGMVRIRATAKGRVLGITLDPSLIAPTEQEVLEDLIVAAFNDARAKADARSTAEMQKMASGMQLPPGFKLPI